MNGALKPAEWVEDGTAPVGPYASCWSCHVNLATRTKAGWKLAFGHRTKGRRHLGGLPWYGWNDTAIRRIHGRNAPDRSARQAWSDQQIRPPVVVTCRCSAENLISLTRDGGEA